MIARLVPVLGYEGYFVCEILEDTFRLKLFTDIFAAKIRI